MIRVRLDLGSLEDWPTDRLPGFGSALVAILPGLGQHGCSHGQPGGFLRRMEAGTWLGHVIEHVALELQSRAGAAVTRGKTRSVKRRPGVYDIFFCYADAESGLAAARAAVELVVSLLPEGLQAVTGLDRLSPSSGLGSDVPAIIELLHKRVAGAGLGPSTAAIVAEARRRGIPAIRLDEASLVQLGTGSRQRRIRASVTASTSLIGSELAANKQATKALLEAAGLPVPAGETVRSLVEASAAAARLGWPVVVKPRDGNHGRGVSTGVGCPERLLEAFQQAAAIGGRVIVERQLPGRDHRVLVVAGKVVAVAERVPAQVQGDGRRSIEQLIEALNADPRRGVGHGAALTRIRVDLGLSAALQRVGLSLADVPALGQRVRLCGTANLSTGGTAIDRTDEIHPDNAAIAVQAAAIIGLDVAGIDMMAPEIGRSIVQTGGGIVEVNAGPGLRMHLAPSQGQPRDVARPIVDLLFPRGSNSRIPIFAVTGTNGKTTTVRMLARILSEAGLRVGFTSTTGVYINGLRQTAGDASGPRSARMVLRNPTVDVAVLETARGGILREGLGFDVCDVGAVLNVTADHLGIKDVYSLEDLARVKSVVVESVNRRGASVLNADDPLTVRLARRARGRIVWFSGLDGAVSRAPVADHLARGGLAVTLQSGVIMIHHEGARTRLMNVWDVPATLGGAAAFNTLNSLAAVAMAAAHGVAYETIAKGLGSFQPSFEESPGRLNFVEAHGVKVILDYAHNSAALGALGRFIEHLREPGTRVMGMVGIPGDRRDAEIRDIGAVAAEFFDEIMFREAPDRRGRPAGSINALMAEGARAAGMDGSSIHLLVDEESATDFCLAHARPGDIVALLPTDVDGIWARVQAFARGMAPVCTDHPQLVVAHG